jgi:hypothetical protein
MARPKDWEEHTIDALEAAENEQWEQAQLSATLANTAALLAIREELQEVASELRTARSKATDAYEMWLRRNQ